MLRSLDIWRGVLVKRPADELSQDDLIAENFVWLPQPGNKFTFRADPFGLWEDGRLHIFVERFDYRDLKGCIELLVYDKHWNLLETEVVLQRPWHLSYPFVFRADGEAWMLPEARRSGQLTLYRAKAFPRRWEPFSNIDIAGHGVDGTLLFHNDRWWLFYASIQRGRVSKSELHVAYAPGLDGPWTAHPMNPVRSGLECTRPGGTPIRREDGTVDIPMQDGSRTYGGSIRRLRIWRLTPTDFNADDSVWLAPTSALEPFSEGLHTLASVGRVSLIDCKFVDRSVRGTLTWRRGRIAENKRARIMA